MKTLSLILPSYNEAKRLPRTFELLVAAKNAGVFQAVKLETIWIVDDGSRDETASIAEKAKSLLPEIQVHRVLPNQGKGNAIHEGLKISKSDWCLIADADSATPWDQFQKLWKVTEQDSTPVVIGSRDLPESDIQTSQSWVREHMGKTFNLIVRLITGLPFKDTQCGFKLIHRPSIQSFIGLLQVKRFAWDVELLMFARNRKLKVAEVPVAWAHQDESHVDPLKDSSEMLFRVIQLRLRLFFQSA